MKIGEYEIFSIETSEFSLDGGAMFGIIPKPMWEKYAKPDKLNRIQMVTRSLLLVSEKKRVLIDTGNGTKWSEKFFKLYNIDNSKYSIEISLSKYGYRPEDISDVICTHLHFDHAGGNTCFEGDKIVPTFPNANYWISKSNWDLANSPTQKDAGSFIKDDWEVLRANNMIKLVEGNEPFIDGIDILVTNGHTRGLLHPVISDENESIFFGADIFPTVAHLQLPWIMAYDIEPLVTIQEKKDLLNLIERNNWKIFFEHDLNIEACTIKKLKKYHTIDKSVKING
ncbi:MAG: MBL fold metallo-hydrolase [Candidatus Marinimicrobia bacterium]|nr:MBL fold metallo-hydrolase [Candidatus Neomarinimicrobiota bacterium]|tara:strand:- start:343 stop:1191 length:849 start_codon:yes stop_codon:yes gene_type:complete